MRSEPSGVSSPRGKPGGTSPDSLKRLLTDVASELALNLSGTQIEQLATHFSLLLRWNEKINLTAVRQPEEIAARHFGESLFLAKVLPAPKGTLIDVGSGAGFPGLALKIVWPGAPTVLLEANHKRATFLKEVVRSCRLAGIEVRAERLEAAASGALEGRASLVTMRAVRPSIELLRYLARLLEPGGRAALFLGAGAAAALTSPEWSAPSAAQQFHWQSPLPIPHSEQRVILIGTIAE
jgi:16S rRNA (guanine527-N7)-methyltransferase